MADTTVHFTILIMVGIIHRTTMDTATEEDITPIPITLIHFPIVIREAETTAAVVPQDLQEFVRRAQFKAEEMPRQVVLRQHLPDEVRVRQRAQMQL